MRQTYVEAYAARGHAAEMRGDWQTALADYERALEYPRHIGVGRPREPRDARLHYLAAQACKRLGRDEQAYQHVSAAADEKPHSGSEHAFWVALAWRELGRVNQSGELLSTTEETARKRIAQRPEAAWPFYVLGLILRERGDCNGARSAFEQCLERDPYHVAARQELDDLRG